MKKVKFLRQTVVAAFLVVAISFTGCKKDKDPDPVSVSGVSLNKITLTLVEGRTATVAPENAENKAVTWKSDKTDVATVDQNGKVVAIKADTATVTVEDSSLPGQSKQVGNDNDNSWLPANDLSPAG